MMRLGVISIVIEGDRSVAETVQHILSSFGHIIIGRMGLPNHADGVYLISLMVRGTNEQISALSGKIGKLPGVKIKSAVTAINTEIPEEEK